MHAQLPSAAFAGALALAASLAWTMLPPHEAALATASAAVVLWLVKSDLDRFVLPDQANMALAAVGWLWIATLPDPIQGVLHSIERAMVVAACLVGLKWFYAKLRSIEALGWGDVKLAAAGAIWLDWPQLPLALLIAALAGLGVVVARGSLANAIRTSAVLPFGAFLAPSIWLVWLFGRAGLF